MATLANLGLSNFNSLIAQLSENGQQELLVFLQNLIKKEKQQNKNLEQNSGLNLQDAREQLRELAGSIQTDISFTNEELEQEIRKAHFACRNYRFNEE